VTTKSEGGISQSIKPSITFVEDSPRRVKAIDLNTATLKQLQTIPGITAATASKIVAARKEKAFVDISELNSRKVVTSSTFDKIQAHFFLNRVSTRPFIHAVTTTPQYVIYNKAFKLAVGFTNSRAGVRLVRLQADSISHSIDIVREVSKKEAANGKIVFDMPGMEDGVMNVQAALYDEAGNKDYYATTIIIFHNPPTVRFSPSERSLRLTSGAALMKTDGQFHCDANFTISNGTASTARLNRRMNWRITNQSGGAIESGVFDFGSDLVIGAHSVLTGWFNFSFPPGNATFNRLRNKEFVRIHYEFREVGTGALAAHSLSWRAPLGPHVNIIRVGEENFTATERTRIFNALRNNVGSIYQQRDMDVGTIRTFIITVAQAGGYVTINSDDEAEDLTGDWTVNNDAIDMFVVRNYVGSVAGLSPVDGPCDKDAKGMNGLVVELDGSQTMLGIIMAHEMGHYLGLPHISTTNNLMRPVASTSNTVITASQATDMKDHCFIRFLG
jgi:hypothetical protein